MSTLYEDFPHNPISGPIVACDNAIAHYEKIMSAVQGDINMHRRKLAELESSMAVYKEAAESWLHARRTLVDHPF